MKIYTRTGDQGETGLLSGSRVAKDDARVEAYGTIDELNALLGLVRAESLPKEIDHLLEQRQHELFEVGTELAAPDPVDWGLRTIGPKHVRALEDAIDRHNDKLEQLDGFILPTGTRAAAALHLARAVCRRAERRLVTLTRQNEEQISLHLQAYLNRLGDLLFVLTRTANARAGLVEVRWRKDEQ